MSIPAAVQSLERDLRTIFNDRLHSLVTYGVSPQPAPIASLVVVESLTPADLSACADRVATWQEAGLGTPLVLQTGEFEASLDAFPFEFGAILSDHQVVAGVDPFEGIQVNPADMRRACEVQARSHLLHLREGYIETEGRGDALTELVRRSAPALGALLANLERLGASYRTPTLESIARLDDHTHFTTDDAVRLLPDYLQSMEQLTLAIDRWNSA
jgi:hypothetical protein